MSASYSEILYYIITSNWHIIFFVYSIKLSHHSFLYHNVSNDFSGPPSFRGWNEIIGRYNDHYPKLYYLYYASDNERMLDTR